MSHLENQTMPVEMDSITRDNFMPGTLTRDGFMGQDSRPIPEIIREDADTLSRLSVRREAVADFLEGLIDEGKKGLEGPVRYGDWTIQIHWARGLMPCPFGEPRLHPKLCVSVTDNASNGTVRFSKLTVHLIREHGFFEGRGSEFRVEPGTAVTMMRRLAKSNQGGAS
jgi:hypothetical protein